MLLFRVPTAPCRASPCCRSPSLLSVVPFPFATAGAPPRIWSPLPIFPLVATAATAHVEFLLTSLARDTTLLTADTRGSSQIPMPAVAASSSIAPQPEEVELLSVLDGVLVDKDGCFSGVYQGHCILNQVLRKEMRLKEEDACGGAVAQ